MAIEDRNLWYAASNVVGDNYGCQNALSASRKLAGLLGEHYPEPNYWEVLKFTDQQKHTLKLITGPHGHTIIKMLEARDEWK